MSDRDEREENHEEGDRQEDDRRESSPDRRDDRSERDDHRRDEGEERREKPKDGPTTSLLVRNISYNLRPEDVKKLFIEFGDIRDVYIPNVSCTPLLSYCLTFRVSKDYYTKKPKGFAFIEFFHYEDAMRALERMDRFPLDGRELSVEVAKDRRKTPDEMRPRGRPNRDYGRGNGRDYGRGGYERGPGGGYGDRDYPPRDYGRGGYDYDRPPARPEYGRRSRSRSRDGDRYEHRARPDFRGREDRFYAEVRI